MRKLIKTLVILFIIGVSFPATAKAETVTKINDLIENAKTLDGQKLVIEGEAIGEQMNRGAYSWVNINDGSNAIGVCLNKADADKIKLYGNYKNIGDTVQVHGVFYRACKEHGGEADFHAISIDVVQDGHPVNNPLSIPKILAAIILSVIALLLFIIFHKRKDNRG